MSTQEIPDVPQHEGPDTADRLTLLEDLRRLSPRQRAVLVLRYFDDLSEQQTADALDTDPLFAPAPLQSALSKSSLARSKYQKPTAKRTTATPAEYASAPH